MVKIKTNDFLNDFSSIRSKVDFIFNMSKGFHGPYKKSFVPTLLEIAKIPYLGSDPYTLSFVRNKAHLKAFAKAIGVPTTDFYLIHSIKELKGLKINNFPLFVKPCFESASIGITEKSLVYDLNSLKMIIRETIENYHQPVIVEKFIKGKEVSVPIIGNSLSKAWGIVGITLDGDYNLGNKFLTSNIVYRYKYGFKYPLDIPLNKQIKLLAIKLYNSVGIKDYGRVDFRISDNNKIYLLEASTHPHIAHHSDFYEVAKFKKLKHSELIKKILNVSFKRNNLI